MKTITLLLPWLFGLSLLSAQDETPPISLDEAIKLGPEGIAQKRGDESEVGYADAAFFYATAKRLQTENRLAAKDLSLVVDLDRYRSALRDWEMAWSEALYAAAGGGTMWARMPAFMATGREDMLAELANRMPLKEGQPGEATLSAWLKLGDVIKSAPVPEFGDDGTKESWPQQMESLHRIWERLFYEMQALADVDAKLLLEHLLPDEEQIGMLKGQ